MRRVSTADSYLDSKPQPQPREDDKDGKAGEDPEHPGVPRDDSTDCCTGNLFSNLSVFFHEDMGDYLKGKSRPKAVGADFHHGGHSSLLPGLLDDMLQRQLYSLPQMIQQVEQFVATTGGWWKQEYVAALYMVVAGDYSVHRQHRLQLVELIRTTPGAFEKLFYRTLSTPVSKSTDRRSTQAGIVMLTEFLGSVGKLSGDGMLLKAPLSLGETPLDVASRHRNSDMVLLLLRHGVKVQTTWMNFRSSLEVLLFSPTLIYLGEEDRRSIEECTTYFRRALRVMDTKSLAEKAGAGYYPLHDGWRHLVPDLEYHQPQSLKHLCRCQIRDSVKGAGHLPDGLRRLPLPPIIVDYLGLLN